MTTRFTWADGERLVRFGPGASAQAPELLGSCGFEGFALLTSARVLEEDPAEDRASAVVQRLGEQAAAVLTVPRGPVADIAAQLLDEAGERPLVALGGGRVIDTAKAIAGARADGRCAAVPTTLSGAPMTPFHRMPAGVADPRLVRPGLVVAEPALMTSQPRAQLAASAMNALAHATEALYTPRANPVAEMAALRAARLISEGLPSEEPDTDGLALGAVLAGYAAGSAGLAIHHAVCQTIVRVAGSPHAETNAVMLPHFARLMADRAPGELGVLAEALGDPIGSAGAAGALIAKLAARCGHTRLSTLGVDEGQLPMVVEAMREHPGLEATPHPPPPDDLLRLLQSAL